MMTSERRMTASVIEEKARRRNFRGQARGGMFWSSHCLLRIHLALIEGEDRRKRNAGAAEERSETPRKGRRMGSRQRGAGRGRERQEWPRRGHGGQNVTERVRRVRELDGHDSKRR